MLQTLERAGRESHDTRTAAAAAPLKVAARPAETLAEQDDGLAAAAGPIMMAAYAVVLTVAVLTFKGNGEALLAVAISIAFAMAFFGVPLAMMRVRARHDTRWRKAEAGRNGNTVDTFTGRVGRTEAVVHMVVVPVAVSIAFTMLATIWVLVQP